MEWIAVINGKVSMSENALVKCPSCGGFYWTGWFPRCGCCGIIEKRYEENEICSSCTPDYLIY